MRRRYAPRRLVRALACAAVPLMFVVGCSADSDSGSDSADKSGNQASASGAAEGSPSLEPVKFATLPDPCETVSGETIDDVVPGAKSRSGRNLSSEDADSQATCLWSGYQDDDNDYQFRSLSVSLKRYDSDPSLGSGNERAAEFMKKQSQAVSAEEGNEKVKDRQLDGLGDEATGISYENAKKDHDGNSDDYREERIVIRTGNVVITVDYEGAGFAGSETPSAETVRKNGEKAAKDAVAAVGKTAGAKSPEHPESPDRSESSEETEESRRTEES